MTRAGVPAASAMRYGSTERMLHEIPNAIDPATALNVAMVLLGVAIGARRDTSEVRDALEVLGALDLAITGRSRVLNTRLAGDIDQLIIRWGRP